MWQQHDQSFASAPHAGSSSHPVHKGGGVLGRVILDNVLHVWNIKPPSCHISAQEAACSRSKIRQPDLRVQPLEVVACLAHKQTHKQNRSDHGLSEQ